MDSDQVIERAIKLRDQLLECAKEFDIHALRYTRPGARKAVESDAKACREAAEMMAKLGTEVTRLRLGIQHFDHGRIDRFELREMVENWNGEARSDAK
jgi:precorrin-6x reductase